MQLQGFTPSIGSSEGSLLRAVSEGVEGMSEQLEWKIN